MPTLPAFWHAAATLSGRLDLSHAVQTHRGRLSQLTGAQLTQLGITPAHIQRLARGTPLHHAPPFVTLDDPEYPQALRPVPYAPPVLFWEGNLTLLSVSPKTAIVGSRRCTSDGMRMARSLARAAAAHGGVVVSGLAWGIDTAAHLAAPAQTIAVLGEGLLNPKSRAAQRTTQTILSSGGLVLSEFLPTWPASKHTFPLRNRVIAGLCELTVVVEAAQRSGAGITARLALEAGREVGAVPGSPYATASQGCLLLLSQGAALIRDPSDMLSLLGTATHPAAAAQPSAHPVVSALQPGGSTFDELVRRTKIPPGALGAMLGALELQGIIHRLPGDRFTRRTTSSFGDPFASEPSHGSE
jgi:DNA processing protein